MVGNKPFNIGVVDTLWEESENAENCLGIKVTLERRAKDRLWLRGSCYARSVVRSFAVSPILPCPTCYVVQPSQIACSLIDNVCMSRVSQSEGMVEMRDVIQRQMLLSWLSS